MMGEEIEPDCELGLCHRCVSPLVIPMDGGRLSIRVSRLIDFSNGVEVLGVVGANETGEVGEGGGVGMESEK